MEEEGERILDSTVMAWFEQEEEEWKKYHEELKLVADICLPIPSHSH